MAFMNYFSPNVSMTAGYRYQYFGNFSSPFFKRLTQLFDQIWKLPFMRRYTKLVKFLFNNYFLQY